jgi:hypothetical protein
MNDITSQRAKRIIRSKVADGSLIRYGDGQIIERGRLAQDTANLADKVQAYARQHSGAQRAGDPHGNRPRPRSSQRRTDQPHGGVPGFTPCDDSGRPVDYVSEP